MMYMKPEWMWNQFDSTAPKAISVGELRPTASHDQRDQC